MRRRAALFFTFIVPVIASAQLQLNVGRLAGTPFGGSYVDGTGSAARFALPHGVATDDAGNIYVADDANNVIRKIVAGVVTTLAGNTTVGPSDGRGSGAQFNHPNGIAFDRSSGTLVVADSSNHIIRRVTLDGLVTTIAGTAGKFGSTNGTGAAARFTYPEGVAVDGAGNIYVTDVSNHLIRKITPAGVVTTLAGSTVPGHDDGFGSSARFNYPWGITSDNAGTLWVADTDNHTIRKISPEGRVTTVAGLASNEGGAKDGVGEAARFDFPHALTNDGAGNVYVADTNNHSIRKITPDGTVTTIAGELNILGWGDGTGSVAHFYRPGGIAFDATTGYLVVADYYNNTIRRVSTSGVTNTIAGAAQQYGSTDGIGANARFSFPEGVSTDAAGNAYVVSDCTVRKITPDGTVTTIAGKYATPGSTDGTGAAARFNYPQGIAVDRNSGIIYVADTYNHTIRKITQAGVVTTFAGLAGNPDEVYYKDGTGSVARFFDPWGLAVDSLGNVYVADEYNQRIRMIEPAGVVTTFAGDGYQGNYNGGALDSSFRFPTGVAVDAARNVYVADYSNNVVRKITQTGQVTTLAGNTNSSGYADGQGVAAQFHHPSGVAADAAGNVYVADYSNHVIRRISTTGAVTTVAGVYDSPGNVNGVGSEARFFFPTALAVDPGGRLLIADESNHALRVATVAAPQITRFDASVIPGTSSYALTWTSTGGSTASIDNGIGSVALSGSKAVTPASTTTYTLTVTGPGGTVTARTTIVLGVQRRRTAGH